MTARAKLRRVLLGAALAAGALVAMPASAGATTFCVNDPTCVGTTQPTIEDAMKAANVSGDADVIQIGASATPYQLSASVTANAGRPVVIRGAGASATTIITPFGLTGITISDPQSAIEDIAVRSPSEILAVVIADGALRRAVVSTFAGGGSAVHIDAGIVEDSTMSSVSGSAIELGTDTTKSVVVRRSTMIGSNGGFAASSSSLVGNTTLVQDRFVGSVTATYAAADGSEPLKVADSIIELPDGGTGVQFVSSAPTPVTAVLRNLTIVGTNSTLTSTRGLAVFASAAAGTQDARMDARGIVLDGSYDYTTLAVGGTAPDAATMTIASSDYDPAPNLRYSFGAATYVDGGGNFHAAPGFVNAATGNLAPRGDSPLVDAGPATVEPWRTGLDALGRPRLTGARTDIGAVEYVPNAPTVSITGVAPASASGGTTVTVTATGSDPDEGETPGLAYAWRLPDGSTASGSSATFVAPDAPGTYVVGVRVRDVSGQTATATATFTVPVERVKPTLKLTGAPIKRAALLKRSPVSVTVAASERSSVTVKLVAVVKAPRAKARSVVVATGSLPFGAPARLVKLTPTKAAVGTLAKLLAKRGATATWTLSAAATDASRNVGTARPIALRVT